MAKVPDPWRSFLTDREICAASPSESHSIGAIACKIDLARKSKRLREMLDPFLEASAEVPNRLSSLLVQLPPPTHGQVSSNMELVRKQGEGGMGSV